MNHSVTACSVSSARINHTAWGNEGTNIKSSRTCDSGIVPSKIGPDSPNRGTVQVIIIRARRGIFIATFGKSGLQSFQIVLRHFENKRRHTIWQNTRSSSSKTHNLANQSLRQPLRQTKHTHAHARTQAHTHTNYTVHTHRQTIHTETNTYTQANTHTNKKTNKQTHTLSRFN